MQNNKNENIGDILARVLNSKGLSNQFVAAHVCAAAKEIGAGDYEPVSFRNGTLKISVSSPARAHLIRNGEQNLILKINEKLKRDMVKRIRFEIRN